MSLVDDHEIPGGLAKVWFFGARKLVGTEDDGILLERVQVTGANGFVETAGLEDHRGEVKLVLKLLAPLLAQVGGKDDQEAPLPLGPLPGDQSSGLNRFTKAHFVGKGGPLREGTAEGEQRGLDLVRIEVNLRIGEYGGKLLHAIGGATPGQFVSQVFRVVGGQAHPLGVRSQSAIVADEEYLFPGRKSCRRGDGTYLLTGVP
ncbi:MAG: hypothetical protein NNA23_03990 [Nitrospira sp.]|nr:hypothetical protein [Nitrospira sp.]